MRSEESVSAILLEASSGARTFRVLGNEIQTTANETLLAIHKGREEAAEAMRAESELIAKAIARTSTAAAEAIQAEANRAVAQASAAAETIRIETKRAAEAIRKESNLAAETIRTESERAAGRIRQVEDGVAIPNTAASILFVILASSLLLNIIIAFYNVKILHSSHLASLFWTIGLPAALLISLILYLNRSSPRR